jgi:hypothetical protein
VGVADLLQADHPANHSLHKRVGREVNPMEMRRTRA